MSRGSNSHEIEQDDEHTDRRQTEEQDVTSDITRLDRAHATTDAVEGVAHKVHEPIDDVLVNQTVEPRHEDRRAPHEVQGAVNHVRIESAAPVADHECWTNK